MSKIALQILMLVLLLAIVLFPVFAYQLACTRGYLDVINLYLPIKFRDIRLYALIDIYFPALCIGSLAGKILDVRFFVQCALAILISLTVLSLMPLFWRWTGVVSLLPDSEKTGWIQTHFMPSIFISCFGVFWMHGGRRKVTHEWEEFSQKKLDNLN
jgi:hypothetical protein